MVEHDRVAVEDILVEFTQVFGIAREFVHLSQRRHNHI